MKPIHMLTGILFLVLILAACTTDDKVPQGCDPSYAGADACTMEYNPVCATLEDGSQVTMGNECTACTSDNVVSITPGECENKMSLAMGCDPAYEQTEICTTEYDPVCATLQDGSRTTISNECIACSDPDVVRVIQGKCVREVHFTACEEPRRQFCTREYNPVCEVKGDFNGSYSVMTAGNACTACSDENISGHFPGECQDLTFVQCDDEPVTGFDPQQFAKDSGAICVHSCPEDYDSFRTQIGVSMCIPHYGEEEIGQWELCEASSDDCNCVRTTETTTGEKVQDAEYRCVPELYAERLLFTSGQERLDENGEASVVIA